jgi:hypothetical protein
VSIEEARLVFREPGEFDSVIRYEVGSDPIGHTLRNGPWLGTDRPNRREAVLTLLREHSHEYRTLPLIFELVHGGEACADEEVFGVLASWENDPYAGPYALWALICLDRERRHVHYERFRALLRASPGTGPLARVAAALARGGPG